MLDPTDDPIRATSISAAQAKHATVDAGYYEDPYAQFMTMQNPRTRPTQVIIKRGTFARVAVVSKILQRFFDLGGSQVVLVGSGQDTSFLRLIDPKIMDISCPRVHWFEIDYSSVIQCKIAAWKKTKLVNIDEQDGHFVAAPTQAVDGKDHSCTFLSYDLRLKPGDLCKKLHCLGLNKDKATLFVSECVFMYLTETASSNLLASISASFSRPYVILYEPILLNDSFGKVMERNLSHVLGGIDDSLSLHDTRTIDAHVGKLQKAGFELTVCCDMWTAYNNILTRAQQQHASKCELLDELEEFKLIMQHYCVLVAGIDDELGQMLTNTEWLGLPATT